MATVPAVHPDLTAVLPDGVVLAPPGDRGSGADAWLSVEHLREHAATIDVLHLHVGRHHLRSVGSPEQAVAWAEEWAAEVRRSAVPLVVTVHDVRDPDDGNRERYHALLGAVLRTAEVVLALTAGAADEIADRYGRTPIAVGHPTQVVPVPGVDRQTRLVGVPLGSSARQLADPLLVVRAALSGAVSGGGRLRVDVHPDGQLRELVTMAVDGELDLQVHEPFTGTDRVAYLQTLQVCVLPPRFGTDSAWLEACRDLGTRVVAPSSGHYAELWSDVVEYGHDEERGLDPTSLMAAVVAALTRPAPARATPAWRAEQRAAVQQVLADVYARVVAHRAAVQELSRTAG